ncbi:MAG: NAD-dependent epimerase/dehydratase family protein [Planctomycetia bacterium]|nr:NAD-dependent epimerase/dehydratase family protein [Planctomycetia bacterium]
MILITGSRGFIGSALKAKLINLHFDIIEVNSQKGGINNPKTFEGLLSQDITHVFHLAGKTFVPDSWKIPDTYFTTNVFGTQNVLEFCRKYKISLTFVSAYVYGKPETLPIAENCTIRPNNPYAQSKYLAEHLCRFYAQEFNLKVNIIRPFNAYGIGQDKRFLIPSIINQALHDNAIILHDLSPKRDYIYLSDLIDALILSMTYIQNASVYNIGSGNSISVKDIVSTVQKILGTDKPVISKEMPRKNEIFNIIADITKANKELNWYPRHSFRDGLKQIVEYELTYLKKENNISIDSGRLSCDYRLI